MSATDWSARADVAQQSLQQLYGAPAPQLLHNTYPDPDNTVFNYWWLAHAIEAYMDAWDRTGSADALARAAEVAENIVERNEGSLFNDYFDDMLWFGIGLERLGLAAQDAARIEQARELWQHTLDLGWNEEMGGGISWRKSQLTYKNTPANGPFIILGARLATSAGGPHHLEEARRTMAWLEANLVRESGRVEDGKNRLEDGEIDNEWQYTYNYGLYIGACVELYRHDRDPAWLDKAERSAHFAVEHLTADGVFPETGGGDVGLFKGIFYRYLDQLLIERPLPDLEDFVRSSTDTLWRTQLGDDGVLWSGDDWRVPPTAPTNMSTQLSAVIVTEMRERLEGREDRQERSA